VSEDDIIPIRRSATRHEEAQHLIQLYGGDAAKIMHTIESQLSILSARAQTLLSLAGITITVTGFSGASIARSGKLAAVLLVAGLCVVLVAASQAMTGILRVRWVTSIVPSSLEVAVHSALDVRDGKTRVFSRALGLLIVGLSLYVASVALLLLKNLPI
jgi:hypothetical protein